MSDSVTPTPMKYDIVVETAGDVSDTEPPVPLIFSAPETLPRRRRSSREAPLALRHRHFP